jgi:hypothetical protein
LFADASLKCRVFEHAPKSAQDLLLSLSKRRKKSRSWTKPRRVVAKVEWRSGELYHRAVPDRDTIGGSRADRDYRMSRHVNVGMWPAGTISA